MREILMRNPYFSMIDLNKNEKNLFFNLNIKQRNNNY